jgi:cyclic pyranopterin phosphate synthase
MPAAGVRKRGHGEILAFEEIVRFVQIVNRRFGLSKVRLTGGEPLVRPAVGELVAMLAAEAVPDLALTTNGQRLAEMAAPLRQAGLQRVNVSLDTLDGSTYAELTRGGDIGRTLAGIEAALRAGLAPVRINTVVLRGRNDHEVAELACFALTRGCSIRFLELMPIGCARGLWNGGFVPAAEVRARLEQRFALEPLPPATGESSRNFLAEDRRGLRGTIGFIASESQPFCAGCTRLRLTSAGAAIACLARGTGPELRELLRSSAPDSEARIVALLSEELQRKRPRERFSTPRQMATVGG